MQLEELLNGFIRNRRGEGKKESGIMRYRDHLRRFNKWLINQGITDINDIDEITILDYRDYCMNDRQNMPATVGKALGAIHAFAKWAIKRGYMEHDPTLDVERPRRRRAAPKPLTNAELVKLQEILVDEPSEDDVKNNLWRHRRNRLACYLMYYAGLRLGEVARLLVRDVNLLSEEITIRGSKSDDRTVTIHPDLLVELKKWIVEAKQNDPVIPGLDGKGMKTGVLAKIFERWLPDRGLKISAHRLRHSFGTEFLRSTGNLRLVQIAMGHASSETTEQYTLVVANDLRPAIAKLPSLSSFHKPVPREN